MQELPLDVVVEITEYLSDDDLLDLRLVSRECKDKTDLMFARRFLKTVNVFLHRRDLEEVLSLAKNSAYRTQIRTLVVSEGRRSTRQLQSCGRVVSGSLTKEEARNVRSISRTRIRKKAHEQDIFEKKGEDVKLLTAILKMLPNLESVTLQPTEPRRRFSDEVKFRWKCFYHDLRVMVTAIAASEHQKIETVSIHRPSIKLRTKEWKSNRDLDKLKKSCHGWRKEVNNKLATVAPIKSVKRLSLSLGSISDIHQELYFSPDVPNLAHLLPSIENLCVSGLVLPACANIYWDGMADIPDGFNEDSDYNYDLLPTGSSYPRVESIEGTVSTSTRTFAALVHSSPRYSAVHKRKKILKLKQVPDF